MARRILDIIADVLTLIALVVAAVGHVLLVGRVRVLSMMQDQFQLAQQVQDVFLDHLLGSGIALGVLGFAVLLSLLCPWNPLMRRLLNLVMFAAGFTALMFVVPLMPWLDGIRQSRPGFNGNLQLWVRDLDQMLVLALVPICFAIFFSLVRMIWTMPPFRPASPASREPSRSEAEVLPRRGPGGDGPRARPPHLPAEEPLVQAEPAGPDDGREKPS